ITCHPAKHHFYEQAEALSRNFNIRFLTSIFFDQRLIRFTNFFSTSLYRFLSKKSHPKLRGKYVITNPTNEIEIFWRKLNGKSYNYYEGNLKFEHWVIKKFIPSRIFIGVDTACGYIFNRWKNKSFLILDLVIALPH